MEKSNKPSHTHGAKILIALLVAMLALVPAPGQSQRAWARDVQLAIWNNSSTNLSVRYCAMGDMSTTYDYGLQKNPCNKYTQEVTVSPGQKQYFQANPMGLMIVGNGKSFFAYVSNPTVGKPYIAIDGAKTHFVEGELQSRTAGGISMKLHRRGDTQALKIMIIEVTKT